VIERMPQNRARLRARHAVEQLRFALYRHAYKSIRPTPYYPTGRFHRFRLYGPITESLCRRPVAVNGPVANQGGPNAFQLREK